MSRYSTLLSKIIAESGYSAKEIVKKCNELGNGIDTTRLSKLQSGKLPAPSEKVSRDISKVCNVDERKLVIEGYIEKAPKEIIEMIQNIKQMSALYSLNIFNNIAPQNYINDIKEMLENEPLSDIVIEILDNNIDINNVSLKPNEFDITSNDFRFILEEPISISIKDNSMSPKIEKNSKVTLKKLDNYNSGDILVVKINNQNDYIVRYALFNKNNIILTPLNTNYESLTYNLNEVYILGKVNKIITTI